MKLYDEFVKLIQNKEYGKLKRVWFTTFTISPDFVERYILPLILASDNDMPKTLSQFEAINAALEDSEIDIRFFYDAKMPIEGLKRTTVNFQGVFWKSGLFHPKVTLIEFEKCSFLMVGSANLSIGGWGRNREAITIKEIGVRQANQVKSFFDQFTFEYVDTPRATKPAKTWDLVYKNLPDELINEQKLLYVWSPYFSSRLEDLIEEQFSGYEVNIIPDTIDGKIRLVNIPDIDNLSFCDDLYSGQEIMTHAKVWITQEKIAIGSHNFTSAALNNENMEASIVDLIDNDAFDTLTTSLKDVESITTMTEEELKEEGLPEDCYSVIAHIEANWKTRSIEMYFLEGEVKKLNEFLPWVLYLPGNIVVKQVERINGNRKTYSIILDLEQQKKCFGALLTDRQFNIENESETIASGYLEEIDACSIFRSPHRYSKLHDFFLDTLTDTDSVNSDRTYLPSEGDSDLHIEDEYIPKLRSFGYFELFEIFIKIQTRLANIKDRVLLKHAVLYAPNSLISLKVLIEKEIDDTSSLYNWFMVHEFNNLLIKPVINEFNLESINDSTLKLSGPDKDFISSVLNIDKGTI